MNFNISQIEKIKPVDKQQIRILFDDHPGLGVTIGTRKMTYFYRYKSPVTKRKRTITLISLPHGITPVKEDIQLLYYDNAKLVANKIDPLEAKQQQKTDDRQAHAETKAKATTVEAVWQEYKRFKDRFLVAARSTQASYQRIYEAHIRPKVGNIPIAQITRSDVVMLLRDPSPGLSNICLTLFKQIEQEAFDRNYIESPFIHHIKRKKGKVKKYFMEDDTLSRFLRFVTSDNQDYWPSYKGILLMQLLTGCQIGELLRLQWNEVSETAMTIPASRIKTERKMDGGDTPLVIPIVPRIREVLDRQAPIHPNWVFPQIKRGSLAM